MFRISVAAIVLLTLNHSTARADTPCTGIISLAPSITETLNELEMIRVVVGRTTYDTYPPEVASIPTIGGFLDPSLETIISLKPSIIIGLIEQQDFLRSLQKLELKTLVVEHRSVEGILESFVTIGKACNVQAQAQKIVESIQGALNRARAKTAKLPTKKVAIVVSRSYESPELKDVYLSGKDGFYNTLIEYAGAKNVFRQMTGTMTGTSLEGLYALDPDFIVEVLPPHEIERQGFDAIMAPWKKLTMLRAVREDKVHLIDSDWATVPGPRLTVLLDTLLNIFHPSVQ